MNLIKLLRRACKIMGAISFFNVKKYIYRIIGFLLFEVYAFRFSLWFLNRCIISPEKSQNIYFYRFLAYSKLANYSKAKENLLKLEKTTNGFIGLSVHDVRKINLFLSYFIYVVIVPKILSQNILGAYVDCAKIYHLGQFSRDQITNNILNALCNNPKIIKKNILFLINKVNIKFISMYLKRYIEINGFNPSFALALEVLPSMGMYAAYQSLRNELANHILQFKPKFEYSLKLSASLFLQKHDEFINLLSDLSRVKGLGELDAKTLQFYRLANLIKGEGGGVIRIFIRQNLMR